MSIFDEENEVQTSNELVQVINESGMQKEDAHNLQVAFSPLFEQAKKWKAQVDGIHVTDASQVREMKLARESRLALREIRIKAEKIRKTLKEDSLRRGKAIDGVYNVLAYLITPLEKSLLEQEQFVERMEAERKTKLHAEREDALRPFGVDTTPYALGDMSDEAWNDLYSGAKAAHEKREAIAKAAEEERIAREKRESEERERVRMENDRLKREAAEREAQAAKERAEAEAKLRKEREAREKVEREAAEIKRREDARIAKEKAAAKAKEDAEKEAVEKAARAPDREKLLALAGAWEELCVPTMKTKEGAVAAGRIKIKLATLVAEIRREAEGL